MDRLLKYRSVVTFAIVLTLVVAASVLAFSGWLSTRPRQPLQTTDTSSMSGTAAPSGPGGLSVRLESQDLTPSSHLSVMAAGFLGNEQLVVTVQDALGQSYDLTTLVAGADGRLGKTSVAPPAALASGDYQLIIVGSTSHRKAQATFRMHDIPPTVTLDTYTSKPGQQVGFAGVGFFAGEMVNVYLGSSEKPLASVRATGRGGVVGHLSIPALAAGVYTLRLVGEQSQVPASVGFSVQGFSAWVVLDRYAVAPGVGVGCIGQGFGPNEQVFGYLNSLKGDPVLRATTDPSGRFVVQDTWVPKGEIGKNVLTFIGQSSKVSATVEFIILPTAEPTAQPTMAPGP